MDHSYHRYHRRFDCAGLGSGVFAGAADIADGADAGRGRFDQSCGYGWLDADACGLGAHVAGGFGIREHADDGRADGRLDGYADGTMPKPVRFAVRVPHDGNYAVSMTVDAERMSEAGDGDMVVYVQERRLVYRGPVPGDGRLPRIIVNVGAFVPGERGDEVDERLLVVSVVARHPVVTSLDVSETDVPTLYLAGDSTVTDSDAYWPCRFGDTHTGWGASLPAYLDDGVAVANHARSGLSLTMFRENGHYAPVERTMRAGDMLLLQFGHNDQKDPLLRADGGYAEQLERFVCETRDRGAYPILVTPLARNTWTPDGDYADLLADYARAVTALGHRLDVPVLDLHGLSVAYIEAHGVETVKPLFRPGDVTHTNEYGSYLVAGAVAGLMADRLSDPGLAQAYCELAGHVTAGFGPWSVPSRQHEEGRGTATHVDQFLRPYDPLAGQDTDGDAPLTRGHAVAMASYVAGLVPVNYYDGAYADVSAHYLHATALQSAAMNHLPSGAMVDGEGRLHPDRGVSLEELLVLAARVWRTKHVAGFLPPCPYDSRCGSDSRRDIRLAYALHLMDADGNDDLHAPVSVKQAVERFRRLRV